VQNIVARFCGPRCRSKGRGTLGPDDITARHGLTRDDIDAGAQNALKLTYRHLEFQKFSRGNTPDSLYKGNGRGREEKTPSVTPGLNPGYAYDLRVVNRLKSAHVGPLLARLSRS